MLSLLLNKVFTYLLTYLLEKQHETTDARATHILQPNQNTQRKDPTKSKASY